MKVSICIPTYNRPSFLKDSLRSCLTQTQSPDEILIGDDSTDDETEKMLKGIIAQTNVSIRYFHNRPSLKQARNVNNLFNNAIGEFIILLHDDDTLLPNAVEDLYSCFEKDPTIDAAFGKQYVMSNDGIIVKETSDIVNEEFYRSPLYSGMQLSSLEAGFMQQFPNDAYLIRSAIVKECQYRTDVGDVCDFDFGLRLGVSNFKLFYLDKYTANYRISNEAISNKSNSDVGIFSFEMVERLDVPKQSQHYKDKWLKSKAPLAMVQAAKLKRTKKAFQIYFGKWHKNRILTLRGVKRLLIILSCCLPRNKKNFTDTL